MKSKEGEIQCCHAHSLLGPRPYPWLLFIDGKRHNFFDVSNQRYYKESIPELYDKRIFFCSRGWFALIDRTSNDCYLFNFISLDKIQLPPWEIEIHPHLCILSSSPSDLTCHILFIKLGGRSFQFCKLGDTEFIEQEIEDGNSEICGAVVVGETIYCLIYRENFEGGVYALCTIQFTGLEVQFTQLVAEQISSLLAREVFTYKLYLIEGGGEIFLVLQVYCGYGIDQIREFIVFAMDFSKRRWMKLASLGERTIFLSLDAGMICSTRKFEVQPDSIYYVLPEDRHLYVLDFRNHTISTSLPCPIVKCNSGLEWVMI